MTRTDPLPALVRLTALGALATGTTVLLLRAPLATPPPSAAAFPDWWEHVGTPAAAVGLLRLAGLAFAARVLLGVTLGLLATITHAGVAVAAWRITMPMALRRAMVASAVAASTALPRVATAAESPSVPVVVDLGPGDAVPGPAAGPRPVLVDLGPALVATADLPRAESPPPDEAVAVTRASDEWTVARGDHLWAVARTTLADRGDSTADADVAAYWRRLIEENRDVLGTDPDLIHPGVVLTLP
jgi:hypothetical protein